MTETRAAPMRDLLFAFVWMALLPLSLMSAHVGVLLWVWVALLSPNELLYGFLAGVPFNKIVALSTFVMMLVSREKKDFYLDATLVLLLCLAVSATISWSIGLVSGPDVDDLYQKLIKEVVLAVIITGVMTTRHRLNLLVFTIVASLAFPGSQGGADLHPDGGRPQDPRLGQHRRQQLAGHRRC